MLPRPSNPTNLPIRSPSSFSCFNRCKPGATLCADDAAHQWPFFLRCALANHIAAANKILRFGKFGVAIVMNRDHFFVLFHAVADAFVKFQSDAVIDLVSFPFPAAPEHGQRCAKVFTIRSGKVSRTRASNFRVKPRLRPAGRFMHAASVSSLPADSLASSY